MENRSNSMNAQREGEILESAIAVFGEKAQITKALEELQELGAELARYLNGKDRVQAIREELADAFVTLNQLELIFGDVTELEEAKLEYLEDLVAQAKEELER